MKTFIIKYNGEEFRKSFKNVLDINSYIKMRIEKGDEVIVEQNNEEMVVINILK